MKRIFWIQLFVTLLIVGAVPLHAKNQMNIVINDHLGTPQMLIDENKNVVWQAEYDEFGKANILVEQVEFNQRFPGQYYDKETGLHYNYYRDYDPSLGRYVQSDPIGLGGGINTYGYVLQNPLMYSDPSGLVTIGNCDVNIFTGKISCTAGNDKKSCTFDEDGNVSCSGKKGPLQCEYSYDSKTGESDFDVSIAEPDIVSTTKAGYEAIKTVAEVIADATEAGMSEVFNDHQQETNDAIDDAIDGK